MWGSVAVCMNLRNQCLCLVFRHPPFCRQDQNTERAEHSMEIFVKEGSEPFDCIYAKWEDGLVMPIASVTVEEWHIMSNTMSNTANPDTKQDKLETGTKKDKLEAGTKKDKLETGMKKDKLETGKKKDELETGKKKDELETPYNVKQRRSRGLLLVLVHKDDRKHSVCQIVVHDEAKKELARELMRIVGHRASQGQDPFAARNELLGEDKFECLKKPKTCKRPAGDNMAAQTSNEKKERPKNTVKEVKQADELTEADTFGFMELAELIWEGP